MTDGQKDKLDTDREIIAAASEGRWMFDCGGRLFLIPSDADPKEFDPDSEAAIQIGEIWNQPDCLLATRACNRFTELVEEVIRLRAIVKLRSLQKEIHDVEAGRNK